MKIKIFVVLNLLGGMFCLKPAFALEHAQRDGLISMNIPSGWHWEEFPEEVVVTYPDGKTMAMDIQFIQSPVAASDIKKTIKQGNAKMIKEGIEAHGGTLLDNVETKIDGVYATRLDFATGGENPVNVTYISFLNKNHAFTITYGGNDAKMRAVMDDAVATVKL